ncbi:phospholipase D family protein [Candidatus Fukatsuia symbiotica]|uniref:phospholipase D n=2 Tax=Candidatus Fukatsuia symbiotica TaxID=1878942 RepID=A0A2U8I989_9GAMM|nr:phospholipase D family protein [Candidatus Fukatsuia symbiotica]AWK15746.1 endonuclease [Candidatus Fukatsuia symbiotica]MEA9446095.1 phospholipase D family protein [Candidatus Fukatsuia symbiotica]
MQSVPPAAAVTAHNEQVTVGFSPSGTALANILNVINSAKSQIYVVAYSFTSKEIATALLTAKKRGVNVQVVVDKKANSEKYTAVTFLANQGVAVRLNDKYTIIHNKFIVIDGKTLQTGSFNYSSSANKRNAENVVVLWNAPTIAAMYQQEFLRLWNEVDTLSPTY